MVTEAPIQVIETDPKRSAKTHKTIGSVTYFHTIVFENTIKYVSVPDSFIQGLRECEAGRTVDMSIAMSQPPPDRVV